MPYTVLLLEEAVQDSESALRRVFNESAHERGGRQRLDFALERKGFASRINDEPARGSEVGACCVKAP